MIFFIHRCKINEQMMMQLHELSIESAAEIIKSGGLVGMPTETVYGLAANAFDADAVAGIFAAKGRPQDNPLIVHVDGLLMARQIGEMDERAEALAERFWPGPLTLVVKSRGVVPQAVTAGLDTVGLRMPDCDMALSLISASGVPIAAPSANKSGTPSPTSAAHVMQDFGEALMVLDAGECAIGIESTVIDLTPSVPVILRPGAVTQQMIEACIGAVASANAFEPNVAQKPASPGMKYRHYAPKARMTVVEGRAESVTEAIKYLYDKDVKKGEKPVVIALRENKRHYGKRDVFVSGTAADAAEAARSLYTLLREADDQLVTHIYFEAVPKAGIGYAVMNRVYKAASYNIVKV